jgi:hypothetical protein
VGGMRKNIAEAAVPSDRVVIIRERRSAVSFPDDELIRESAVWF